MKDNIVPGSDGAGTVEAVGKHVTRFQPGGTYIACQNHTSLSPRKLTTTQTKSSPSSTKATLPDLLTHNLWALA